jgi:hypothetical protein
VESAIVGGGGGAVRFASISASGLYGAGGGLRRQVGFGASSTDHVGHYKEI